MKAELSVELTMLSLRKCKWSYWFTFVGLVTLPLLVLSPTRSYAKADVVDHKTNNGIEACEATSFIAIFNSLLL